MSTPEGLDRSKAWMASFVLSIVVLIVFFDIKTGKELSNGKERYIVSCCSLGITFGIIFTAAAYVEGLKRKIYGNAIETTFAIINIALWSVGVGILQSPKNDLANTTSEEVGAPTDSISNANLYFASWLVFAASASILGSILKDKGLFDAKISWAALSKTMNRWFLLLVASLVVLITSTLIEPTSKRIKYATSVGAICVAFPFLVMCSAMCKCTFGVIFQLLLSVIIVALYAFEVAFITSSKGPAHAISNLYFSSWIGFLLSISLFMSLLDDFNRSSANAVSEAPGIATNGHTDQIDGGQKNDELPTEDVDL